MPIIHLYTPIHTQKTIRFFFDLGKHIETDKLFIYGHHLMVGESVILLNSPIAIDFSLKFHKIPSIIWFPVVPWLHGNSSSLVVKSNVLK
jgi:hypothetical protein